MTTPLHRSMTLTQITLYGVGTILGAGIYVLLGEVALISGIYTPFAFLVAALVVSFSAYSYRHLARRFPYSAGEAIYVYEAFSSTSLSRLVGLTIVFSGIVSAATITRGFTGYFALLFTLPDTLIMIVLVFSLTGLAAWGVRQSVAVAVMTTIIELSGIALVIWASADSLPGLVERTELYFFPNSWPAWSGIAGGAFIAFYAFIGFEDMVNMAEEVRDPEKNMFSAIILAVIISGSLYVLVAFCAVAAVNMGELASAGAPLALIVERNTNFPVGLMAGIGLIAVINGALLQIIMCSRVLYGMGKRSMIPAIFARVHKQTKTPLFATLLIGGSVILFALLLPLVTLAKITSTLILGVFTLVNAALLTLNWRTGHRTFTELSMPLAGMLISLIFIILQHWL
jgi:amino acid transporter